MLFFFFQAEDGIRDLTVTGVQTCALPISGGHHDVDPQALPQVTGHHRLHRVPGSRPLADNRPRLARSRAGSSGLAKAAVTLTGVSRAEFFACAARSYLDQFAANSITRQINEALQTTGDDSNSAADTARRRVLAA